MLRVLNEEDGFDIKSRELMRLRTRNRWLLRAPNGDGPKTSESDGREGTSEHESPSQNPTRADRKEPSLFAKGPAAEGRVKHAKQNRRRRRRKAPPEDQMGLSARFPSETTLDQARRILGLEAATYRMLRRSFQIICHQEGVLKKTLAGAERWEAVKTRLVRDIPQLQSALWSAKDDPEPGKLALDVICTDVTKRMRDLEARMTLAEAKNALGINPEESRAMRADLHRVLSESQLTCKSEASPQQWADLKQRWSEGSILVQRIMDGVDSVSDSRDKARALEVVARDVMKRIRDSRVRLETRSTQQPSRGPGASPQGEQAPRSDETTEHQGSPVEEPRAGLGDDVSNKGFDDMSEVSHASRVTFSPASNSRGTPLDVSGRPQALTLSSPSQGLPQASMLESSLPAALRMGSHMESSILLGAHAPADFIDEPYVHTQYASTASPASAFSHVEPVSSACAVYLRLHPSSSFMASAGLWIATLDSHSVEELRNTAVERFPGTICMRVEGILKDGKGRELPLQIQEDRELAAYMAHLQGTAPTFAVQLVWKTS